MPVCRAGYCQTNERTNETNSSYAVCYAFEERERECERRLENESVWRDEKMFLTQHNMHMEIRCSIFIITVSAAVAANRPEK